jgi:hypothetical protein
MPVGLGSRVFYRVAGAGIEPASGGYAYHYNFHCPAFLLNLVCGLDYAFIRFVDVYRLVSTPSISCDKSRKRWLGSALPFIRIFSYPNVRVSPNLADNLTRNYSRARPNCSSLPRYLSSTPLFFEGKETYCFFASFPKV